jgi:hypothetical protein
MMSASQQQQQQQQQQQHFAGAPPPQGMQGSTTSTSAAGYPYPYNPLAQAAPTMHPPDQGMPSAPPADLSAQMAHMSLGQAKEEKEGAPHHHRRRRRRHRHHHRQLPDLCVVWEQMTRCA